MQPQGTQFHSSLADGGLRSGGPQHPHALQMPLAALLGLAVLLSSSSQNKEISNFPLVLGRDGPFQRGNAARKMMSEGEGTEVLWG